MSDRGFCFQCVKMLLYMSVTVLVPVLLALTGTLPSEVHLLKALLWSPGCKDHLSQRYPMSAFQSLVPEKLCL